LLCAGVNAASSPSDASARERAPLAAAPARRATALLVIDMISAWDFPDAGTLAPRALRIAPRIAALKARCQLAGVPVIYANDNRGRWRSAFGELVEAARRAGGDALRIAEQLTPTREDYRVLKPKHSAFYATPLGCCCAHLAVRHLILTGVTGDQCVLATRGRCPHMRDFAVAIPPELRGQP
jgi:nicotinamidase-related amidase